MDNSYKNRENFQMDQNMMMQAMQEMQRRVAATQEKLKTMSVSEVGGGGIVKVTVSGEIKVTGLEIEEEARKNEEKEVLEDLIITTLNKAIESALAMKERELGTSTEGLLPNIPGLNFRM